MVEVFEFSVADAAKVGDRVERLAEPVVRDASDVEVEITVHGSSRSSNPHAAQLVESEPVFAVLDRLSRSLEVVATT